VIGRNNSFVVRGVLFIELLIQQRGWNQLFFWLNINGLKNI